MATLFWRSASGQGGRHVSVASPPPLEESHALCEELAQKVESVPLSGHSPADRRDAESLFVERISLRAAAGASATSQRAAIS